MNKTLTSWSLVAVAVLALAIWGIAAVATDGAAGDDPAPLVTAVFEVEGMTCGGCEAGVKLAVERLDGVRSAQASYRDGRATVTYDETQVTPEAIVQAIEKLGYSAELVPQSSEADEALVH